MLTSLFRRKDTPEKLKDARVGAKLTGGNAAKSLNISLISLWRIEKGTREPKLSLFKRMAKLYGADPLDLMNWED